MVKSKLPWLVLLGTLLLPPAYARAAQEGPRPQARTFVAVGPTGQADLTRLRAALLRVEGVLAVEVRPEVDGATVTIQGESSSLVSAAARTAGFTLRPTPVRAFSAKGPASAESLAQLRRALAAVPGVERVDVGPHASGAAVRLTGTAPGPALAAAAQAAAFELKQLGAYVAAGPSGAADMRRLRAALERTPGVESVELHALDGGATVLVRGFIRDSQLTAAAKGAGFEVWPLGGGAAAREFRLGPGQDPRKLRDALQALEGIGQIDIAESPEGARLKIAGGRVRPDAIVSAAREAGIEIVPLPEPITLPTADPVAGRGTPPDYDHRVLDARARPGALAPDFALLGPDGKTLTRLSDYRQKRPVVLLFGSCT